MGVWNAKKKNNKIRRGEGHKNVVPHMLRAIDLPSATVREEVRRAYPFLFFFFLHMRMHMQLTFVRLVYFVSKSRNKLQTF